MKCSTCAKWIVSKKIVYADGFEKSEALASDGKGLCETLKIETEPDFACSKYTIAIGLDHHHQITTMEKESWEYWENVPCPDCDGLGSRNDRACRRCAGTAKVRLYADGYLADETWDHPKFKAIKRGPQVPEIDPGTIISPIPEKSDTPKGL